MAEVIRIYQHGGPEVLTFETIEAGPPGPREVLVQHEAVGLNFADTYFRTGLYPAVLPTGMGVEASGTVRAVGSDVSGFQVGDRVTYTGSPLGAYATERVMPVASLIRLPDSISFDTAAASTMRGLTAGYLLRKIWPLEAGDIVLFHAAAGGVGLLFCQWAALLGIEVIGTVSNERKGAEALSHGCKYVINTASDDVVTKVREFTEGRGVRVVYDGIGRDTFETSLKCLGRRALMVCLGTASGPAPSFDPAVLVRRQSAFITRPALADYLADESDKKQLTNELFAHLSSGAIKVEINQRYQLSDAVQAHRDLESRSTIGSSIFDLSSSSQES